MTSVRPASSAISRAERGSVWIVVIAAVLGGTAPQSAAEQIGYVYDEAGRLSGVVAESGGATAHHRYLYDRAGNLTVRVDLTTDTDEDGMPDHWEHEFGLDASVPSASLDSDGDGLTDLEEHLAGASPVDPDTDGDGMPDGWEVAYRLDPLTASGAIDTDGDGLTDLAEYLAGTSPRVGPRQLAPLLHVLLGG